MENRNGLISDWVGNFVGLSMIIEAAGFLSRLRKDVRGNVVAIAAAMIIPMIGLVGGAVDMSRLYATKTRLQSACDSGALAGRRTMGAGLWGGTGGAADLKAKQVFDLNFTPGSFGSINPTRTFTEATGTVSGTATAQVPMTLMRLFGNSTSTVTVNCTSMMVIPNTDVMFVLDTTGSMAGTKITGLRTAVKCFYEALARLDTSENCGPPPSGGLSSAVQLRFGFMPYATNVNVGKLLPTSYFADDWSYQSREYTSLEDTWAYTLSSASTVNYGSYNGSAPNDLNYKNTYSAWTEVGTSGTQTINGLPYARRPAASNSPACIALNLAGPSGNRIIAYTETPGTALTGTLENTTNEPPVFSPSNPPTQQVLTYEKDRPQNVQAFAYGFVVTNNNTGAGYCTMYKSGTTSATGGRTYYLTATGTATKDITWTRYSKVTGFTYKQKSFNISGLKNGNAWNNPATVSLPLNVVSSPSIRISGQSSTSSTIKINVPSNATVTWNGCIEDAAEPINVNWATGIPSNAYGAQIDFVPSASSTDTLWKPVLTGATWGRYDRDDVDGDGNTSEFVYDPYPTTTTNLSGKVDFSCPREARKLQQWPVAQDFEDYVDSLTVGGNTYHDVGLVWGGRFISPDGIFSSENAKTPAGASIQRHLIFMTDGDTVTDVDNYTSQGIAWWDRRQTGPSAAPTPAQLDAIVNARFSAICTAIKNKGIILWVVSYGGGTSTTANDRLRACSSDPNTPSTRYFNAANTADLLTAFQTIANRISSLRLTN